MKKLYFITHNKGKFDEAEELAKKYHINIQWLNIEYQEIQENNIEKIARNSCYTILDEKSYLKTRQFFLEDAGLFIPALNGFPGPYSAYVFKTIGNEGILKLMIRRRKREAYFQSVIAFYDKGRIELFTAITKGKIIDETRGDKGFGFDPIFIPEGEQKTFGEMPLHLKNNFSHRIKALRKLLEKKLAKSSKKNRIVSHYIFKLYIKLEIENNSPSYRLRL